MNQAASKKKPTLAAKAALMFGSGTLTSRILGLIRDSIFFAVLPIDTKDAWLAAFRLPNFFRRLLGEGGLSVSFIPIYIKTLESNDEERRERLSNGVFTLLMSLSCLICLLCAVFAEPLVRLWLSGDGFSEVPGKIEMTVTMARIMVFFLIFITLFAYFMALLNSHKKFGLSGYAPMFLNLSIIAGLYGFKDSPDIVEISAYSVLVGGFLQAIFLLPGILQLKILPKISFHPVGPEVKAVLYRFIPTIFGVGVLQILAIINTYFASLYKGGVSYIYLADRLLELPLSLIAVSIGTALLPTLSAHWNRGEKDQLIKSVTDHLSLFYFLAIPATFGLFLIGTDIVAVLFRRGEFNQSEVILVGQILNIYSITLLAAGGLKIISQSLYSTGDTLTPALISLVGLVIHLLLAPALMVQYQLLGMVASTVIITTFNLVICTYFVQKRVARLHWAPLMKNMGFCFLAAVAMGGYLLLVSQISWQQGSFLVDFPLLLLIIVGGGGVYFLAAWLLKVKELNLLLNKFKKRL